jgi:hypothetical protein
MAVIAVTGGVGGTYWMMWYLDRVPRLSTTNGTVY